MNNPIHTLNDLFGQLGLPDDQASIDIFVAEHSPLSPGMALAAAPFWSASQARFLREEIGRDADWAQVVDTLAALLSR